MPRIIDDVVVPERRRSIRNISVSDVRRKSARNVEEDSLPLPPPPPRPLPPRLRKRSPRKIFWALLVAVLVLTFTTLSFVDGATLSYTPRQAQIAFEKDTFSAYKTGESLLYSVVKLSGDKGMEVAATGEKEVSKKASGTIVIYNDSATAQKLIENNRFETPDGKIYRISQAVNVPAKGSLEAVVYADAAGPAYNITPTDFTIPGLKGTDRFKSIYARSKTPMAGGFVGMEKSVDPQALSKGRSDLQSSLGQELLAKAKAEVPAEFILFPSLSSINFEDLPQTAGADADSAIINLRGHLYGVMFKRNDLALALASSKLELAGQEEVAIEPLDALEVSFSAGTPADLPTLTRIDFKVNGSARVVWRTDEAALRLDLSGRGKSEVPEILKNYPTIEKAQATVRPFWKSSFPQDSSKITVKILNNESR